MILTVERLTEPTKHLFNQFILKKLIDQVVNQLSKHLIN